MSAITISKNLIKYRKRIGISQEKLAEEAESQLDTCRS